MSAGADRLALTRLAILEHLHRKENPDGRSDHGLHADGQPVNHLNGRRVGQAQSAGGWFGSLKQALLTWWHGHPAHTAVELATPYLSDYARRSPAKFIGIAGAAGAVAFFAKPWKLISVTGLLIALFKSTKATSLLASVASAASYRRNNVSSAVRNKL